MMVSSVVVFLPLFALSFAHPRGFGHYDGGVADRDAATPTIKYPIPAKAATFTTYTSSATYKPEKQPCGSINGTTFLSSSPDGTQYTFLCDIDFPGQDIYPFHLTTSFDECVTLCEEYNKNVSNHDHCAGLLFASDRIMGVDDCYLKSSLNNATPASIHLLGGMINTPAPSNGRHARRAKDTPELLVATVQVLGSSTTKPTKEYISHAPALPQKLANNLLVPGLNEDLVKKYPIATDTGSWTSEEISMSAVLADMKVTPHMSRDGGKGGKIGSAHLFIFCDTASFQIDDSGSQMIGFVSSSVATDDGMKALYGQPLDLADQLGEWQDDVGRMRGFAPMTTGEEAFNIALSGNGYRYAVWPESSLIPLNATQSLLYPALVYDVVDMETQAAVFNDIGNSVLAVSVDPTFGPFAERVVSQLFQQNQVTFGTLGGIRSWGSAGQGGNDGHIYLFGLGSNGVLVARTVPDGYTDLSSYEYWDGGSWSSTMTSSDSSAVMLNVQVQDMDVIYVPALRTFLMVYLNTLADNTFYYRYLPLDLNADSADLGNILMHAEWSDEKILAKIDAPVEGFVYAGGLHAGYFGDDDITNGGWKMLITWTEHTGKDAASPETGYAHKSAYAEMKLG
jgi:hypothetical protein